MKSRDSLIRIKRFDLEEKRRRVAQIEMMIAEFERMSSDLDREIAAEEAKAGILDPSHYAYPTYARAAAQRRDNLRRSADDLKAQLDEARADAEVAFEDLKKVEVLDGRERTADRATDSAREQAQYDRIGLGMRMARA
jgi:flagellar export protein FliJ